MRSHPKHSSKPTRLFVFALSLCFVRFTRFRSVTRNASPFCLRLRHRRNPKQGACSCSFPLYTSFRSLRSSQGQSQTFVFGSLRVFSFCRLRVCHASAWQKSALRAHAPKKTAKNRTHYATQKQKYAPFTRRKPRVFWFFAFFSDEKKAKSVLGVRAKQRAPPCAKPVEKLHDKKRANVALALRAVGAERGRLS